MRWNAIALSTSLLLVVFVAGCGLFAKKKADMQTAEALGDPYAAPTYEEPVQQYERYPDEPDPAVVERSYPMESDFVETPAASRFHVVAKKDTLYRLARMYYNDASRWRDIYEANHSEIVDPDRILIGQRLLIP